MEDLRTNSELLSLATGYDSKVTEKIMRESGGSFSNLFRKCEEEFATYKGVGKRFQEKVSAIKEISKRRYEEEHTPKQIKSGSDVWELMMPRMANLTREEFWILILNTKYSVIKRSCMFIGGINAVFVDLKCVLKETILNNGVGVIFCHNHPSNSVTPSREDDDITIKAKKAFDTIGIKFLDHIIVCEKQYYSYLENGRI